MKKIENRLTGINSISLRLNNDERRILLDVQTKLNNALNNFERTLRHMIESAYVPQVVLSDRDVNEAFMQYSDITKEWNKINVLLGNYTEGIKTSKELIDNMFTPNKEDIAELNTKEPKIIGKIDLDIPHR